MTNTAFEGRQQYATGESQTVAFETVSFSKRYLAFTSSIFDKLNTKNSRKYGKGIFKIFPFFKMNIITKP